MKILIVATTMGLGGAEKQVTDLVEDFASKGHEVTIIALKDDFHFKHPNNVELIRVNSKKNILGLIKSIYTIVRTIRRIRPDIVHSHMATANLICWAARIFTFKTPLICTAHSINEGGGKMRMAIYRLSDFLCNQTTNVSNEAVDKYVQTRAAPRHKIVPIYNGIDLSIFKKKHLQPSDINGLSQYNSKGPIILNVARLVEAKDHDNLFHAFKIFKEKNDDSLLLIAGDGPLKVKLLELASSLGISESVVMLGARFDIPDLMSISDLFVLSSEWEGFGLVLAEAMACELPVISTDCGGTKEVVNDFGLTVAIKDPNALCSAMQKTLELSPSQLFTQKQSAKKSVESRFDIKTISNTWLALYKKHYQPHKTTI